MVAVQFIKKSIFVDIMIKIIDFVITESTVITRKKTDQDLIFSRYDQVDEVN